MRAELTVREVLEEGLIAEAQLLAGEGGLDRPIKYVTIMDAPDMADWLTGQEMLLCNLYLIKDDPTAQAELVSKLAGRGVSALVVKRRWVPFFPPSMLEIAEQGNLPLIEVPVRTAWIQVLGPVMAAIRHRELSLAQDAASAHNELTNACLRGGGFQSIADILAHYVARPVAILDRWQEPLAVAAQGQETAVVERVAKAAASHFETHRGEPVSPAHGWCRLTVPDPAQTDSEHRVVVAPIASSGLRHGVIAILEKPQRPITDREMVVLAHACTTAAFEFRKQSEIEQLQRRFANDFLNDVLSGNIESREALLRRARSMGWKMEGTFFLLICDIDRFESYYLQTPPHVGDRRVLELKEQFVRAVRGFFPEPDILMMDQSDSVAILLPEAKVASLGGAKALAGLAKRLCKYVHERLPEITVSIGIAAKDREATDLALSAREARTALRLGRRVHGKGSVMCYDELGLHQLLESVPATALQSFWQDTIGRLQEYDAKRGTELVKTLETYFLCNERATVTHRRLHVHPNTLKYRLKKIEELTHLSVRRSEDKLLLLAGLRIATLLETVPHK